MSGAVTNGSCGRRLRALTATTSRPGTVSSGDLAVTPQATIALEQGVRATLGCADDGRPGASGAERVRAAGHHARRYQPGPGPADVPSGLLGHRPPVRRRLGLDHPAPERDRHRRHHVEDRGDHDQLNAGAWMHFPVSVGAGGSVLITVNRVAGANAVLSGVYLGGAGTPPTPPPPRTTPPQGSWVGASPALTATTSPLERLVGRPRGHAAGHDRARAGRPGDLGCANDGRPGASGAERVRAAGHHARRYQPGPGPADVPSGLLGHRPPVRRRLGLDHPAPERDRHRRHHVEDRGDHDQLQRGRLDALPGQRRRRGLGPDHRQPRGRRQRRAQWRVPGRYRHAATPPPPPYDATPGQLGRHLRR